MTAPVLASAEGSGYFIQLERPELVIDAIRTVVEEVRLLSPPDPALVRQVGAISRGVSIAAIIAALAGLLYW
jgi:hypothetical protein